MKPDTLPFKHNMDPRPKVGIEEIHNGICKSIGTMRTAAGKSIFQLATDSGLSRQTIVDVECGRIFDTVTIGKILDTLASYMPSNSALEP